MITGGCLCGSVRYQSEGAALFSVICHCRDCQKSSGSGHVPVMGVSKSGFRVTGETRGYSLIGGSHLITTRHFCPACGSLLFGTPDVVPDMVSLYVGSLDDPSVFEPECALFTRDRWPWDTSGSHLPGYETKPD
ncbi:MAG TPA: GFA family protein [Dyella sp.]|nr:GFA family protein [Dyella sp.]